MGQTWIAVNKSGYNIPVYNDGFVSQIGYIAPNEVFAIAATGQGTQYRVDFRNNSAIYRGGWINTLGNGDVTPISNYPAGQTYAYDPLNPNTQALHDIYNVRRSMTVYTINAEVWGSVAAGQQVMAKHSYAGQNGLSHPDWLQINYVKSTSGSWVNLDNGGVPPQQTYGYVPMGLEYGSMPSTISVYGTW